MEAPARPDGLPMDSPNDQRDRRIEHLRGRIEVLKARKQTLLGISTATGMDSAVRKKWAEKLDKVIVRLGKFSAELAELEREAGRK